MRANGPILCAILLAGVTSAAHAGYYFQKIGRHFVAGNTVDARTPIAAQPISARAVFFTPTPDYRRPGYLCIPLTEVVLVGGRPEERPGTVCKANGI